MASEPTYDELKQKLDSFEDQNLQLKQELKHLKINKKFKEWDKLSKMIIDNLPVHLQTIDEEHGQIEQLPIEKLNYFYKLIIETSPLGITIYNEDGQCILANPSVGKIIGTSREVILSQNFRELKSWQENGLVDSADKALKTSKIQNKNVNITTSFGRKVWLNFVFVPFKYEEQKFLLRFVYDITERKQVEEILRRSEENHRALFDNMMDSACYFKVLLDKNTKPIDLLYLEVNQAYEKDSGKKRDELIGKRVTDIFPNFGQTKPNLIKLYGNVALGGEKVRFEKYNKKQGIWNGISCYCPKKYYCVVISEEITDQKLLEHKVKTSMRKLSRSNKELEQFAYIASHDLQEPLRKVLTFGNRLSTKYNDVIDERGQDYLERMQNAARRGQQLINDLLEYSRVTTKARPFVPININDIVKDTILGLELLIEKNKAQIHIEELPIIEADEVQMNQVFSNLITNALKYRKSDIAPNIKIWSKHFDNVCKICIEDNGIGFDNKFLDKIFEPFQRLHGHTEYAGSGIGLAICRKIVERHNGSITAIGEPDIGSKFIITLPYNQHKNPIKE